MSERIRPKPWVIFLFLLPPMVLFTFAVLVPVGHSMYNSFFEYIRGQGNLFVGLKHYQTLLNDARFWQAFGNNIYLVIACVIGQIGLAFVFVMFISSRSARLRGLHRTVTFFPSVISAVTVGLIWKIVFDYRYGLLNFILGLFGKSDLPIWLESDQIMLVVSIPLIWQYIGFYMLIMLSAISSIDKEIFEVAEIDGANALIRAVHITLPLIKNTVVVCLILCIAGNMKAYDHVLMMTKGGPGYASNLLSIYAYNTYFDYKNPGYASAISIGILVLSLSIILVTQFLMNLLSREKEVMKNVR